MSYILGKILFSLFFLASLLFSLLTQHYGLTKLRRQIPELAREVRLLQEENSRLQYEIERFENPKHLMDLAKRPEFSHLKHPYGEEILVINVKEEEPIPATLPKRERTSTVFAKIK